MIKFIINRREVVLLHIKKAVALAFSFVSASIAINPMSEALALSLVTQDISDVTAFQTGANVLGFDDLPGNSLTGFINPQSQLTRQFQDLGIVFSSTGGSVGVVSVKNTVVESDAKSPFNLIGGSVTGSMGPVIDYSAPIEITFTTPNSTTSNVTSRIGAWNDPTGGRIRLSVFDLNGNLLESEEANQGFFIGISNPNIASAKFEVISAQRTFGFSLDDVTFTTPKETVFAVPEPSSIPGVTGFALAFGAICSMNYPKSRRNIKRSENR